MQQVVASDPVALPLLARFRGVLIEDSRTLPLPPELVEVWRGTANAQSQQTPSALKRQVQGDMLTGQVHGPLLQEGRAADSKTALGASRVQAGPLRRADRGFWKLLTFEQIEQAEGYWLSSIHLPVALSDAQEQRLDLAARLRGQQERLGEDEVRVGSSARLPAHLLVLRVPEVVAQQRLPGRPAAQGATA